MQNYPTDEELYEIVKWSMNRLSYKFAFGYFEPEDLVQWAFIKSKEVLHKWDRERPLNKFLSYHLKNQLCNLRREKLERIDAPCGNCPFDAYIKNTCVKYQNMDDCDLFRKWSRRNSAKKSIMQPVSINDHNFNSENSDLNEVDSVDFFSRIIISLTVEESGQFVRLQSGELSPHQVPNLIGKIQEWLEDEDL